MYKIIIEDVRLPNAFGDVMPQSVQTVVTSPPYYGLRNYGAPNEIGRGQTFAEYVSDLVRVFQNIKPLLTDEAVVWLNLGDLYNSSPSNQQTGAVERRGYNVAYDAVGRQTRKIAGMKRKDLVGQPWAVGRKLVEDGWRVIRDYIWWKPNGMPDAALDRPTATFEHVFALTLSDAPLYRPLCKSGILRINTHPYAGAHFATFPAGLVRPMILSTTRVGDTVLDPFVGSGTTLSVAVSEHRNGIGVDVNPMNIPLIEERMRTTQLVLF